MIRNARPEDAGAMTDIYNFYIRESVATFDTDPLPTTTMSRHIASASEGYPCLICEEEGQVAGFCYAHPWKEKAAYRHTLETTVYLHPEHTGKGLGRQLMERLIETCRTNGFHVLIACITGGNEASITLHQSLGFKQVSRFEKVGLKFGRQLDVVDFELELQP